MQLTHSSTGISQNIPVQLIRATCQHLKSRTNWIAVKRRDREQDSHQHQEDMQSGANLQTLEADHSLMGIITAG